MDKETFNILRLYKTKGIGNVNFYKLLQKYQTIDNLIDNIDVINNSRNIKLNLIDENIVKQEIDYCNENNIKILTFTQPNFPKYFVKNSNFPPVLYVIGDETLLNKNSVSIVGSRICSDIKKRYSYRLAQEIGKKKFIIISGLALGIDEFAHKGSINTGTIAVMAGGVDVPYPPSNVELYHDISKHGCIISQMPPKTKPSTNLFPIRNKLIAGLSMATVVVEADLNSGSIITANYASEYGKDVFAIPCSPTDGRGRGCNKLIKNGAYLAETADDVVSNLNYYITVDDIRKSNFKKVEIDQQNIATNKNNFENNKKRLEKNINNDILEILQSEEVSQTKLFEILDYTASDISIAISELEINDLVKVENGIIKKVYKNVK